MNDKNNRFKRGDLVYIPSNVCLMKEDELIEQVVLTRTTNEPDYGLIVENKDKHNRYKVFWNSENWLVKEEDIFELDFSHSNSNFGEQ